MKVLVFAMASHGFQEACQYEAALQEKAKGNDVLFLYCDGSLKMCGVNRRCNNLKCAQCSLRFKSRINKLLPDTIQKRSVGSFVNEEIASLAKNALFEYDNTEELKQLNFHGVDVGFAALSSYISWTRNLNPVLKGETKEFFDRLIALSVKLTLVTERVIKEYQPDMIVFHNGRYPYYKPFYRLAQLNGIPYLCTETNYDMDKNVYQEFIENDIPHSIDFWTKKMHKYWDGEPDVHKREEISTLFFENRRGAKYSGDKIYTKDQIPGTMPDGFNPNIENIAIFNSSEDEFGAIGQEVSKYSLFQSQYDGIKAIAERYKKDKSKHFYLRIHPNLNGLPFDYHVNLYKLNYPNLTVIPGTSSVSSYALMDACDKVIVFGSTMGAESAYWKKPVICLSFALYYNLGCVYTPKTKEEAWALIETKNLPHLDSNSPKLFAFSILTSNKKKFQYVDLSGSTFMFRGRKRIYPAIYKLFGSTKLYYILTLIIEVLYEKMPFCGRFSKVPI